MGLLPGRKAQAVMKVPLAGGSPSRIASSFFYQIRPSRRVSYLLF